MTPDFRSYKKLWEYAVLSLGKDKASAVEHLTLTEFTFLLRMHQLVTRLYHRSPDACIGMLSRFSYPGSIRYLLLFNRKCENEKQI